MSSELPGNIRTVHDLTCSVAMMTFLMYFKRMLWYNRIITTNERGFFMRSAVFRKLFSALLALCVLLVTSCGAENGSHYSGQAVSSPDEVISSSDEVVSPSDEAGSSPDIEEMTFNQWLLDGAAVIGAEHDNDGADALKLGAEGDYTASAVQYICGLEPGYYYLETYALNEGNQEYCYIYARGSGQGECMTAVPRSTEENTDRPVTVRGIEVAEDGIMEVGVRSKGSGQYVRLDSFSIAYEKDQNTQYESFFGGAVSWLNWVEDMGGKYYYADGTQGDALQIMAENGCNFVRLELYNNPGRYVNERGETFPEGYKDADSIFDLARRAHSKGMKIQLSFMYSDYWGNSAIPCDWIDKIKGIDDQEQIRSILSDCIYEFTKAFMTRLAEAGIYPEYVSLGNEMNGGILEPYGCTYASEESLDTFCAFMDAGYRAVKEVSPDSLIVLHIACNADDMFWESKSGTGKWFFGLCEENGVKYDVIGTSFYPYWAQTDDRYAVKNALDNGDLVEWCNMMIDTFDKDILVMESGINWGKPGQLANNGAYKGIYPCTHEGQRDYMFDLINAIKSVKDGRCVGNLYWDPVLVKQDGIGYALWAETGKPVANVVETTTFFGYGHQALPVLDAYNYNRTGDSTAALHGIIFGGDSTPLANQTFTLSFDGKDYSVTTDSFGAYYIRVEAADGKLSLQGGSEHKVSLEPGQQVRYDFTIN